MNTAFVKIWGEIVGAVAWDEKTGLASFEYDTKFKKYKYSYFFMEGDVCISAF